MKKTSSRAAPAIALGLAGVAVGGLLVRWGRNRLHADPVIVESRITILAPVEQVWREWAPLVTLPRFLSYVEEVEDLGGGRSRWTARLADGAPPMVWEAEELERIEERLIHWQTVEGTSLHQDGEVRFEVDPNGRGTIVRLRLGFQPGRSLAQLGAAFAKGVPKHLARQELRRLKAWIETGEIPTIDGQPSGREPLGTAAAHRSTDGPESPDTVPFDDQPLAEPVLQA